MSDENNSSGLGGLNLSTSEITGANSSPVAGSASAQVIEGRKQRSDKGKPRGARSANGGGSIPAVSLTATQFAELYKPELWGRVLSAPGDALALGTGKEIWRISKEEREALGATGSIAAQCFAVSDPKWLAVSLAIVTVLEVYATRAGIYMSEKRKEDDAKKNASLGHGAA